MTILLRQRGEHLDTTEEIISPSDVFSVAIRVCCQTSFNEAQNLKGNFFSCLNDVPVVSCVRMPNIRELNIQKLTICKGQEPVRWQCPHCLATTSLSVLS